MKCVLSIEVSFSTELSLSLTQLFHSLVQQLYAKIIPLMLRDWRRDSFALYSYSSLTLALGVCSGPKLFLPSYILT